MLAFPGRLAALSLVGAGIQAPPPPPAPVAMPAEVSHVAKAARKVLRRCGGTEATLAAEPDSGWSPIADSLPSHQALRTAMGAPMPEGAATVMIHGVGGHLETTEYSIAIARGADGQWHGTAVGRSSVWIKDAPFSTIAPKNWTVPPEKGRRIDAIVDGACLYAEPAQFATNRDEPPPLGVLVMQLSIVTPRGRHRATYLGGQAKGLTAELDALARP